MTDYIRTRQNVSFVSEENFRRSRSPKRKITTRTVIPRATIKRLTVPVLKIQVAGDRKDNEKDLDQCLIEYRKSKSDLEEMKKRISILSKDKFEEINTETFFESIEHIKKVITEFPDFAKLINPILDVCIKCETRLDDYCDARIDQAELKVTQLRNTVEKLRKIKLKE